MKKSTFTSKKLRLNKLKISKINNLNNISGGGRPVGTGSGIELCRSQDCKFTDPTFFTSYVDIN